MPAEPRSSRPHMPGYGILDAASGQGLLPWSWAAERLSKGHTYWIATTRPDGAPHAMAVWGVWLEDRFCFSTGRRSRKARNLVANPKCVVCTEQALEAVIVEGVAELLTDPSLLRRFVEAYKAKYQWDVDTNGTESPIYAVRPRVVFGFIEHSNQFTGTATRWVFEDE